MKEEAKAMGMDEILKYLIENSDVQFQDQLRFILDKLMAGAAKLCWIGLR